MKSSTETKCYFLPTNVSSLILQYDAKIKKGEFESTNKSERTKEGEQLIKESFIKLNVDRLGNISPSQKKILTNFDTQTNISSKELNFFIVRLV